MTNSLMDLVDMVVGYLSQLQTLWLHHIFWFHLSSQEQLLISMPPKALEISGFHYSTCIYRPLLLSPWKWFMRTGYLSLISGQWRSSKCHRPSSQWLLGHSRTLTHELGYLYTRRTAIPLPESVHRHPTLQCYILFHCFSLCVS